MMKTIGSFIITDSMKIQKDALIKTLADVSYQTVNFKCIPTFNDRYAVGFVVAGYDSLPGSKEADEKIANYDKVYIDGCELLSMTTRIGNTDQRICIYV